MAEEVKLVNGSIKCFSQEGIQRRGGGGGLKNEF